jgi:nicotinate-nucleotide adenylyltransferase
LPASGRGQRIGLFGGSFNPPHEGHRLVATQCLKRLGLDAAWILVSPGNPLKDNHALPPLAERVRAARELMHHPRIHVTGFEAAHGFRYTFETLQFLKRTLPDRRFVWIMGTDSFKDFDHWQRWREIAAFFPMAIYARPGSTLRAPLSKAGTALSRYRIEDTDAGMLATCLPPAWVFLSGLMSGLSSTAIRSARPAAPAEK